MEQKSIVVLASLDTKGAEAEFLINSIQAKGCKPILLDIGYGGPANMAAGFPAPAVAAAAGKAIETVHALPDTSARAEIMKTGAISLLLTLVGENRCDAIIGFGGASNTTLATRIMKSLPIGIPKLAVSSAAAMPAYASFYFGGTDITVMNSLVDISGLNHLTRDILERGAGAICGMARPATGQSRRHKALGLWQSPASGLPKPAVSA